MTLPYFLTSAQFLESKQPLNGSYANFQLVETVVPTCLKQDGQRQACMAQKKKVVKPLCNPLQVFSLLSRREEFIHSNLDIILVKSRKEPGFQPKN